MKTGVLGALGVVLAGQVLAAEPLVPIRNPSLYENQGVVASVDAAGGAIMIDGKRYKANANTVVFVEDGRGPARRLTRFSDIPANSVISFSAGDDGTVTQIRVGNGIQPYRP